MKPVAKLWVDIKGYEDLYAVSSDGEVYSKRRNKNLKPTLIKGYFHFILSRDTTDYTASMARLVAIHFIPNPDNKREVNHKNGIKTDNRICNLEWCTRLENVRHAHKKGLVKRLSGSQVGTAKLNDESVLEIRALKGVMTQRELGWFYNVQEHAIYLAQNKKTWKTI